MCIVGTTINAQVTSYSFAQSSGSYTAISGGTVLGTTANDDQCFGPYAIGFDFTYNGTIYTQFSVSSNGFIGLDGTAVSSSTTPISGGTSNNIISALGLDLQGQTGSDLRYELTGSGSNRVLVIQWSSYRKWNVTGEVYNFQIRLNETSNTIAIVYNNFTVNGSYTAQVGLRGSSNADYNNRLENGTTYTTWAASGAGTANTSSCRLQTAVKPANNQTYTWTPPAPCVTPTAQPTALTFSSITLTGLNGAFTAASPAPSGYLVVRSTSSTLSSNPVDGTTYSAGNSLGGGTVIQAGATTNFTQTGLTANTKYYYFIFSYNNTVCTGGPKYLTTSPLQNDATTCPGVPTAPTATSVTLTGFTLGWTAPANGATDYTVDISTTNFGASIATFPQTSASTSLAVSGLNPSTTYYYRIRANNASCSSAYTAVGSVTTLCANVALTYTQGFNAATIPVCWSQQYVNGTSNIQFVASSSSPNVTPQEGADYVYWNSYSYSAGKSTRLVSPAITTTGTNSVDVEFQWYHDAGSSSYADGVYVEYSTDGSSWTTVGSIIPRYHATLSGWNLKTVTLPAGAGNQANLYVGFKFYSAYGNNCSMDAAVVKPTPPFLSATALTAFGNVCTSTTSAPNSFTLTGNNLTGDVTVNALTGYTYCTTAGGTYTSTLTITPSSESINQTIYVKLSPTAVQSYSGNISISGGGATPIDVAASGTGIDGTPTITGQPASQFVTVSAGVGTFTVSTTGAVSYQWQESTNGGSSWSDISNGGVYSGATTATLAITNPGIGMNYYQYKCIVTGCAASIATDGNATLFVTPAYCTPAPDFGSIGITRVVFNTIDNATTGTTGYQNYTASQSTTVILGSSYNLSVYANTNGAYYTRQRAWIDWNQDGDFDDAGEEFDLGQTYNVANGLSPSCPLSITIPTSATPGMTRMRVSSASGTYYAEPCENGLDQEFEDYTIVVQTTPLLSASSLTGFGNVTVGTTAGPNSFTITGQYLTTADVTVGPLTGYTFCTASGGTYTSSLSIPQSGDSFSQTIYVKFSPVAAQSYDGDIAVGGGGATSINVPVTGTGIDIMSYLSSTTTQPNTNVIPPFTSNGEILCIKVVTNGSANPINATYLSFLTTGSTNAIVDIGSANLYYTGASNTFSASNQFGSTKIQPNGRFSFTGSQTLVEGTNYFWLAYDLPITATVGNLVDAQCDTVTVSDTVRIPAVTNPAGSRLIGNIVMMNNNNPESVCLANFYDNGGPNGNYNNNVSYSKTFSPSAGHTLKMVFSSFLTADASDTLNIYDGPNDTYPLIGRYRGATSPGTVIATSATGKLTVTFKSNASGNEAGWNALVTCEYLPPNCASYTSPADGAINVATNTPITWTAGATDATHNPATSYKLYFGTDASATNIHNGTDIGNINSWGMMLNTNTTYYWKIVPTNASGDATGCSVIRSFTTDATQTITTLTVNGVANPPTSYATIKSAYNACTDASPYIINVTTGYAGEFYPITINADVASVVSNRSSANPITIRPTAGFSYTFTGVTKSVFTFSGGANNVTIDGRQDGTGTANSFVFENTSTTVPVINFTGQNSDNTIKYCKIQGRNQSTGIVDLRNPSGSGIRDITIDNNEICPNGAPFPTDGIYTEGTAALPNTNIVITNNKIYDIYADVASATHGITFGLNTFNFGCTISGNSIYMTSSKTPTSNNISWYGMYINGDNHTVTNNYVGGTAAACGGATPLTILGTKENHIYAIHVNGSSTSTTVVSGNTVNNISLSSTHRASDNMVSRTTTVSNHTFAGLVIRSGSATVSSNMIGGATAGSITVINTNTTDPSTVNDGSNFGYSAELAGIVYNSESGYIDNSGNTVQGLWCYPSSSVRPNLNSRVIGIYADPSGSMSTGYTHKITNNTIGGTGGLKSGNGTTSDGFAMGILSQHGRGNVYIKNNSVSNIEMNSTGDYGFVRGIHNNGGIRAELENNTITNIVCAAENTYGAGGDVKNRSLIGLMCDNDGGDCDYFFIIRNTISDLRSTANNATVSVIGLYYRHNIAPVYGRVYGNKIFSINAASNATASKLIGMWAYGQNTMTYNNMITLGNNVSAALGASCPNSPLNTGNYELIGIENNYGKNEYYYNSVNIIGTSDGGSNTYAYKYVNSGTENLQRVFRNNIFSNTRSSTAGTQKNYAFSVSLNEAYAKFTSDYNYFYVSGTNGVLFDDFGTDRTTIAAWTASSGKDANSTGTGVITPADPIFVAPTTCDCNLNITDLTSPVVGTGSSTGIPAFILDDFNNNNRAGNDNAGAVVVGANILPIELLSFTGSKVNNKTKLEWITATEINNDRFVIERSLDGYNFKPIANVKGAGNSNNAIRYEAFDESPNKGINYYRLKQVDYDGAFSYSNIVAIKYTDEAFMVNVYPNPFNQQLNININGANGEEAHITIVDITGKTVYSERSSNAENNIMIELDGSLPNGVYFLKIQIASTAQTLKIVKFAN